MALTDGGRLTRLLPSPPVARSPCRQVDVPGNRRLIAAVTSTRFFFLRHGASPTLARANSKKCPQACHFTVRNRSVVIGALALSKIRRKILERRDSIRDISTWRLESRPPPFWAAADALELSPARTSCLEGSLGFLSRWDGSDGWPRSRWNGAAGPAASASKPLLRE